MKKSRRAQAQAWLTIPKRFGDNFMSFALFEMEERPKNRLCLKLGQRKLSFQQQKAQTVSKIQEDSSKATSESTPPFDNGNNINVNFTKYGQGSSATAASREIPPLSGLCNLGNTCYINSLLQVLRFCPHFSEWIGDLNKLCECITSSKPPTDTSDTKQTKMHSGVDTHMTNCVPVNSEVVGKNIMECSEPQAVGGREDQPSSVGLVIHLYTVSMWSVNVYVLPLLLQRIN